MDSWTLRRSPASRDPDQRASTGQLETEQSPRADRFRARDGALDEGAAPRDGDVDPERLSAERLAHDVAARGVPAVALPDVDAIVAHLAKSCAPGDVVVTLSNGGFGGSWEKLLEKLGSQS